MAATPPVVNPVRSRSLLRSVVRRISKTTSSQTPPAPPACALVEIDPHRREPDDARKPADFLSTSAFDDLPPPELYDPAWNTLPLRGEAGRLAPDSTGPVLPVAFTLNSSDLDDTDSEDDCHTSTTHPPLSSCASDHNCPTPVPHQPTLVLQSSNAPSTAASTRTSRASFKTSDNSSPRQNRKSTVWRRMAAAPLAVSNIITPASPSNRLSVFDSSLSTTLTAADIRLIVEHDFQGELTSQRATELRARVTLNLDNSPTVCTFVFALEHKHQACRVSVRRSFADSFRISNDHFDWFCTQFTTRFYQLRHLPQQPQH